MISRVLLVLLAVTVLSTGSTSAQTGENPGEMDQACVDFTAFWPLWQALSASNIDVHDPRSWRLFPLDEVLAALRSVPLAKPLPASFAEATEYYRPPNWYSDEFKVWERTAAYAEAARLYVAGQLPDAIREFDALVAQDQTPQASPPNPFRAAAAYTAARAAFRLGNFEDGATRVDRILADPDMREFWVAAWELIPRIRYGTDAAPLGAAELAQISRLLTLRNDVLCRSGRYWGWDKQAQKMGDADVGTAIAEAAREDFALTRFGSDFLRPGFDYAEADPVIAALLHMPAYPNFDSGRNAMFFWHFGVDDHLWSAAWTRLPENSDAVLNAREHWRSTRNPLWALELGRIGGEQDLPVLVDATAIVRAGSNDLSERAKASLVWALTAYRARILLMAGNRAEAIAALRGPTPEERRAVALKPPELVQDALESVVNSGGRFLLAQGDLAKAREWAIDASAAAGWPIAEVLKPLLVDDLSELYRHPVLRLTPVDGVIRLGPWRELLDTWSSTRLIEFSRRYDVAPEDRRAMVGAAWIRAFALKRWNDVFAWLPDLRVAFPILSPDIDLIEQAWLPATKRHLATRLALRAPGLVALPSWSRPPGEVHQMEVLGEVHRPADVLAFDPYNASDGNWWCSPKPAEVIDEDRKDFVELLSPDPSKGSIVLAKEPLLQPSDDGELAALEAAGSATQRMAEDAIAWARHREWLSGWFGSDDYLPETLHLAVRATRFGCRRPADNGPWSRAAFKLLHERFPASEWARKTPYWFGVVGQN